MENEQDMVNVKNQVISFVLLCTAAVCCVGFPGSVYADDLLPPSWRGMSNTTFQEWNFFSIQGMPWEYFSGIPDAFTNRYGTPGASSTGVLDGDGNILLDPGSYIILTIPNQSDTSPDDYAIVSFQITYFHYADEGKPAVYSLYEEPSDKPLDDLPGTLVDEHDVLLSSDGDRSWRLWQSVWQVKPSQTLTFRICEPFVNPECDCVRIDDIIVDTQCVPEPSSLFTLFGGLAGIGGIAWQRRK